MGCLTENVTNPYHDTTAFVVLTALLAAFIPWIVGSSVLVVASVTLVKQLDSPHNHILRSIAVTDFFTGVVAIPLYLAEDINKVETQKFLLCHRTLWQLMLVSRDGIQTTNGYFLALLCVDSFTQLNFPVAYKNHSSIRTARIVVLICLIINFTILCVFFGIAVAAGDGIVEYRDGFVFQLLGNNYLNYLKCLFLLPGSTCVIFSIQVRVLAMRHKGRKMDKITVWLSLSFIVLYIPTILVVFLDNKFDQFDLMNQIARLFRFGVPLTNGYIIYLTRPIYKVSFQYFLRTNPRKWKNIQYRRRKSTMIRPSMGCDSQSSAVTPTSQLSLSSLQRRYSMEFEGIDSALDIVESSSKEVVKPSTDSIERPAKVALLTYPTSGLSALFPDALRKKKKVVKSTESSIKAVKHSKDNFESSIKIVKPSKHNIECSSSKVS